MRPGILAAPGTPRPPARRRIRPESPLRRQHILFVCTANIDRSRTAEDLYAEDPRYEVRSAGVSPWAATPVTRDLLRWADRVFVMSEKDDGHRTLLKMRFPDVKCEVNDLDIADRWTRGHPELVKRLLKKLQPHLGKPEAPRGA